MPTPEQTKTAAALLSIKRTFDQSSVDRFVNDRVDETSIDGDPQIGKRINGDQSELKFAGKQTSEILTDDFGL